VDQKKERPFSIAFGPPSAGGWAILRRRPRGRSFLVRRGTALLFPQTFPASGNQNENPDLGPVAIADTPHEDRPSSAAVVFSPMAEDNGALEIDLATGPRAMADLCIVTTCMGRLAQLRQTLGPMLAQDGGVPVVVVDYSCPDSAGAWVEANHPTARLVRVPDRARFNASAARNIGARSAGADAEWVAFVDSDVVLDPGFAAEVRRLVAPGGWYRCRSNDPGLGGTFVCARGDFERVGGYDEVYPCWGEEDNDLFDAFEFAGLEGRSYPADLVRHLAHDDAARTRYYPVADKELGHSINRVYRLVKWDIARVNREQPPLELRRALYERVAEKVKACFETGGASDLGVTLRPGIVPGGGLLSRDLAYRLTRNPREPGPKASRDPGRRDG
jgi:hypothetical protein